MWFSLVRKVYIMLYHVAKFTLCYIMLQKCTPCCIMLLGCMLVVISVDSRSRTDIAGTASVLRDQNI